MIIRPAISTLPRYKPGIKAKRALVTADGSPIARLNANEGPWAPFPDAIEAMAEALTDLNWYPDQSYTDLKLALAERYGLDAARFAVGSGSGSLIRLLTMVTIDPGDQALMPWPPYPAHGVAVGLMGGEVVRVPLVDGAADVEGLLDAITDRTRLVLICSPHNPTGGVVTRAAFESYLERVPNHVVTLLDQAYQEYVTDPDAVDGLQYLDHEKPVVVFRTFSKAYGLAGLRSGYAAAGPELIEAMGKATETFTMSHVAVVASVASLARKDLVEERSALNAIERSKLTTGLAARGLDVTPSQGNFVWVDTGRDAKAVSAALLARGIQVRSGEVHDAPAHIRVTCGRPDENDQFLAVLDDVLAEVPTNQE
jgi:histidinol-phosphate aminotransferase